MLTGNKQSTYRSIVRYRLTTRASIPTTSSSWWILTATSWRRVSEILIYRHTDPLSHEWHHVTVSSRRWQPDEGIRLSIQQVQPAVHYSLARHHSPWPWAEVIIYQHSTCCQCCRVSCDVIPFHWQYLWVGDIPDGGQLLHVLWVWTSVVLHIAGEADIARSAWVYDVSAIWSLSDGQELHS